MEEGKEALVPSTTVPKMTASSAKNGFQHAASKVTTGSPRNLSTPVTSPVISKQPLLNGTVTGASSIKSPNIHSAVSLPPVGSADVKMEIVKGSNFTYNGGTDKLLYPTVMNSTCIYHEGSRPKYIHVQVLGNMHKTSYTMGKIQEIHMHLTPPLKLKVDQRH